MRLIDADELIAYGWHLERHGAAGRCLSTMSIADVTTANQWISTKERLPETDTCVLAVANGTYGNISFEDAVLIAECSEGGWYIESFLNIMNPQIDYWMPLPNAPERSNT